MKKALFDLRKTLIKTAVVTVLVGVVLGLGGRLYGELLIQKNFFERKVETLERFRMYDEVIISNLKRHNSDISDKLQGEKARNDAFNSQIGQISGVVGTLQKLSNTDKELLQKYSKVYFLNENYVPSQLTDIESRYFLDKNKAQKIHTNVLPFLDKMIAAAAGEKIDLKIVSAYRSFEDQAAVKTGYKVVYGSGANQFSADQGYSEHQLGTTVDLTTPEVGGLVTSFEKSDAYKWLTNNAYKFGFTLSYPKSNSYYKFEPWHWRFVGVSLATRLHGENKYFYDLTQRDISTYLISIFDQ